MRDADGKLLCVVDERQAPQFEKAPEREIPVPFRIADPVVFFLPVDASRCSFVQYC